MSGPQVTGPPAAASASLPAALPAPPVPSGPVVRHRQLIFAMGMSTGGMSTGGMMSFTIDGRTFDPTRDDQTVQLGTTEEWDGITFCHPSRMSRRFDACTAGSHAGLGVRVLDAAR
jgi:FtsP/CotA-like multicopper oxidase with cupredoxin domain